MRCETCRGLPAVPPCPACNGSGSASCCEGAVGGPSEATNGAKAPERAAAAEPYQCPPLAHGLPLRGTCRRRGGQQICGICVGDIL